MEKPLAVDSVRAAVRANIDLNSQFDSAYVIMNGLATVVACYGLFANSPAVVIGAMIIAMLLGPIAGVSLALVDLDNALLRRALPTLLGGFLVVYGTAFLLGLIHRDLPLTDEIYARTAPNLMDILIALGGGAAGAYSMIAPRLSVAFVGVAIATALVPPLSASALCLARGEYELAFGALLLAFTNIVGIQVAGSVVMWLGGYRGRGRSEDRLSTLRRNLLSVVILIALAVFLSAQLQNLVSKQEYESSVRKLLTSAAKSHNGAHLVDVRFEERAKMTVVVAVYRTPSAFTPDEVRTLEPQLPRRQGAGLELLVRSVPISVASKSGYLFSDQDLRH